MSRDEELFPKPAPRRELEIGGVSRSIFEWSQQEGAAYPELIRGRLKLGWTPEDAVFRVIRPAKRASKARASEAA